MDTEQESDQQPEEGPESYTPNQDASGSERDEAESNPGGADGSDSGASDATGNPANAG